MEINGSTLEDAFVNSDRNKGVFGRLLGLGRKPKYEVAVVIPLYKVELNNNEKVSLDRCFNVLTRHPVIIVKPLSLDVTCLREYGYNFQTIDFPDKYFESVDSYSQLLLSHFFYKKFLNYKYILIYQTDAYVFHDELLKWCYEGFDYIGAPWLDVNNFNTFGNLEHLPIWLRLKAKLVGERRVNKVGNGGLSLRKVASFYFVARFFSFFALKWPENEDVFWSCAAPAYFPVFKIPDAEKAMFFAFELKPRYCFDKTSHILPFGCHGWEKYDFDFWQPIIHSHGYKT